MQLARNALALGFLGRHDPPEQFAAQGLPPLSLLKEGRLQADDLALGFYFERTQKPDDERGRRQGVAA